MVGAVALAAAMPSWDKALSKAARRRTRQSGCAGPGQANCRSHCDVPVYLVGVGTVRALNMVLVRALVNGTVLKINFQEGRT